jgi:hypothetical protein
LPASGHQTGWGVNLSGSIHTVGKDNVLLQVAYGEGIANYFVDGGVDLAPRSMHKNLEDFSFVFFENDAATV